MSVSRIVFKMVLLGEGAVGKTSIRERYLGKGFKGTYMMTLGADFALKRVKLDKTMYVMQIWDLAGQSSFTKFRSNYYKGAMGGLLIFDISTPQSFEKLENWIVEVQDNRGELLPLILIGNKSDLRDTAPETVSRNQAEEYARKLEELIGFPVPYIETSALEGENIDDAFEALIRSIAYKIEREENPDAEPPFPSLLSEDNETPLSRDQIEDEADISVPHTTTVDEPVEHTTEKPQRMESENIDDLEQSNLKETTFQENTKDIEMNPDQEQITDQLDNESVSETASIGTHKVGGSEEVSEETHRSEVIQDPDHEVTDTKHSSNQSSQTVETSGTKEDEERTPKTHEQKEISAGNNQLGSTQRQDQQSFSQFEEEETQADSTPDQSKEIEGESREEAKSVESFQSPPDQSISADTRATSQLYGSNTEEDRSRVEQEDQHDDIVTTHSEDREGKAMTLETPSSLGTQVDNSDQQDTSIKPHYPQSRRNIGPTEEVKLGEITNEEDAFPVDEVNSMERQSDNSSNIPSPTQRNGHTEKKFDDSDGEMVESTTTTSDDKSIVDQVEEKSEEEIDQTEGSEKSEKSKTKNDDPEDFYPYGY